MTTLATMFHNATELGREHGENAASWVDVEDERQAIILLGGYDDGDPEIMDIPGSPLSGEWADSMTPDKLYEMIGATDDDRKSGDWIDTNGGDLCDEYETAYSDAFWRDLLTRAKGIVTPDPWTGRVFGTLMIVPDAGNETDRYLHTWARKTASDWHGGQPTALYALASSGAILLPDIEDEIEDCHRYTEVMEQHGEIGKLEDYVKNEGLRGRVRGWSGLHW